MHYYRGEDGISTDITFNFAENCPDWPVEFDASWRHVCLDMRSCLSSYDSEGQMFQVSAVRFSTGSTFWIDEVSITPGPVTGMYLSVYVNGKVVMY